MKLPLFLLIGLVKSACRYTCRVKVANREECQKACDDLSYCDAWTLRRANNVCYIKQRTGWKSIEDPYADSGIKNQSPLYEANTNFQGGDYCCND